MPDRTRFRLPLGALPPETNPIALQEVRAVWISRFDWTIPGRAADPAKLDEIVENCAAAGINMLLFQVRAVADAYYLSQFEPWADRVSGRGLGRAPQPYWDPLAYLIKQAHAAGLQVHAYFNVYPVAEGGDNCQDTPPRYLIPTPLYHRLAVSHGANDEKNYGLQWRTNGEIVCTSYRYASPASTYLERHLLWLAAELATFYEIDGLHLDHVRYGARQSSCDPVSLRRYHGLPDLAPLPACPQDEAYADWQRSLISNTVRRFYEEIVRPRGQMWLSAAVWPIHRQTDSLKLPAHPSEGYRDYYQDSKAWAQGGYIDALMPMIYPATYNCPDDSYWTQDIWQRLAADFQAESGGRYVVPGIGARYCTFDEIGTRIDMARRIGAAGHALFSYRGLLEKNYFTDLRAGPYATPAAVPALTWR